MKSVVVFHLHERQVGPSHLESTVKRPQRVSCNRQTQCLCHCITSYHLHRSSRSSSIFGLSQVSVDTVFRRYHRLLAAVPHVRLALSTMTHCRAPFRLASRSFYTNRDIPHLYPQRHSCTFASIQAPGEDFEYDRELFEYTSGRWTYVITQFILP